MVPAFDGGDDVIGVSGPDEGFGVVVGFGEETVDGGVEVDEGSEADARLPLMKTVYVTIKGFKVMRMFKKG